VLAPVVLDDQAKLDVHQVAAPDQCTGGAHTQVAPWLGESRQHQHETDESLSRRLGTPAHEADRPPRRRRSRPPVRSDSPAEVVVGAPAEVQQPVAGRDGVDEVKLSAGGCEAGTGRSHTTVAGRQPLQPGHPHHPVPYLPVGAAGETQRPGGTHPYTAGMQPGQVMHDGVVGQRSRAASTQIGNVSGWSVSM